MHHKEQVAVDTNASLQASGIEKSRIFSLEWKDEEKKVLELVIETGRAAYPRFQKSAHGVSSEFGIKEIALEDAYLIETYLGGINRKLSQKHIPLRIRHKRGVYYIDVLS
jgi:hypothetical protein